MKLALFAVIILVVFALILALPTIRIDEQGAISSPVFQYIRAALYFIPTGTCSIILRIIIGLQVWRVIVALIKTIWELLPVA